MKTATAITPRQTAIAKLAARWKWPTEASPFMRTAPPSSRRTPGSTVAVRSRGTSWRLLRVQPGHRAGAQVIDRFERIQAQHARLAQGRFERRKLAVDQARGKEVRVGACRHALQRVC